MSTNYSHIAVSFFPSGLRNVFGIDAIHITNHLLEATHLLPSEIIEQIISAVSHQKRADILNKILSKILEKQKHTPDKRVADFILNHKSHYQKKLLEYNISERHFQRLFYRDVGLNPTLFKRLYRFEEVLSALRNNPLKSLTDLAFNFGYADQSHFCREFKMFTGQSPNAFIKTDRVYEEQGAVQRPDGVGHLIGASL